MEFGERGRSFQRARCTRYYVERARSFWRARCTRSFVERARHFWRARSTRFRVLCPDGSIDPAMFQKIVTSSSLYDGVRRTRTFFSTCSMYSLLRRTRSFILTCSMYSIFRRTCSSFLTCSFYSISCVVPRWQHWSRDVPKDRDIELVVRWSSENEDVLFNVLDVLVIT